MTRWAEAISTRRITAQDVGKFVFENICCRFGTPLEIIFDHGPGFRGDVLKDLLRRLNVKHMFSSPYCPQCNCMVKKGNGGTSKKYLKNRSKTSQKIEINI